MSDRTQAIIDWLSGAPLRVAAIFIVTLVSHFLGNRAIARAVAKLANADLNVFLWVIAIGMIMAEFGFDLGPVIASAGIVGVALGLGSQTLVKDFLSGIFMLAEDQYGVGDTVKVGDVEGVVEKVGLRITNVRDSAGTLWFLRNGEILVVGNKSKK
jgi:small-conductance mechanosensitive channel